jgi:hypothetical protein
MRSWMHPQWRRNGAYVGIAVTVAALGLVVSATPALAHANVVTATTSCPTVAGADYQVTWTVANDWNLPETAHVSYATGGSNSLSQTTLAIPASGNGTGGTGQLPYKSVSVVQTLPQSLTGTLFFNVSGTYSDSYATSNSGQITAPTNCPPVVTPTPTTIAGPAPVAPANAALVSPTTIPATPAAVSPPTTIAATPPPAKKLKIGHSANGLKRPTLLASTLPPAKPHVPITKAANFTG